MLQYAEFLRLAINKDTYRDLIPSLGDLLSPDKYALEPEVAFLLYRPVLSRVPFPDPPDPKDEEDGEIPDGPSGGETPMEVERGSHPSSVSHSCYRLICAVAIPDTQVHVGQSAAHVMIAISCR